MMRISAWYLPKLTKPQDTHTLHLWPLYIKEWIDYEFHKQSKPKSYVNDLTPWEALARYLLIHLG